MWRRKRAGQGLVSGIVRLNATKVQMRWHLKKLKNLMQGLSAAPSGFSPDCSRDANIHLAILKPENSMLVHYSLDTSPIEVVTDERFAAIMRSLNKHYAGQYRLGAISTGLNAPVVLAHSGKIIAKPARFGIFRVGMGSGVTTIRLDAATRSLEEQKPTAVRGRIAVPATSFTLTPGTNSRISYRITPADGRPVMYLAGIFDGGEHIEFSLIVKRSPSYLIMASDAAPVVLDEADVRAFLEEDGRFLEILSKEMPEFSMEKLSG
ncbi:MAG: hypothetical protein IKF96_03235 [Eggerthellaceae bacterium]|nr:hypothetical protein [Eggerthellaceae bacterium]